MRYLLLVLPIVLVACESTPRYLVAGEDQSVDVLGRDWTVTQLTIDPPYFRAVRDQSEYFLFGPPARTKTAQAIAALQAATGCNVIRSTLHRNVSDHFFAQMDCSANPGALSDKVRLDTDPVL